MVKLDKDIKTVAKSIIQGQEKRKSRIISKTASDFDVMTSKIVDAALSETCSKISCDKPRKEMQKAIYKSIVYNKPYECIENKMCGRRQFYDYRKEFITRVAERMKMLPKKKD